MLEPHGITLDELVAQSHEAQQRDDVHAAAYVHGAIAALTGAPAADDSDVGLTDAELKLTTAWNSGFEAMTKGSYVAPRSTVSD